MPTPQLPEAELDVLLSLQRLGEATARQIREHLHEDRPMTHGAMCMLLSRLQDRGLVARRKGEVGKAYLYRPEAPAETTRRSMAKDLLHRAFEGSRVSLVHSLFESTPPSASEIDELEALLDRLKGGQGGGA